MARPCHTQPFAFSTSAASGGGSGEKKRAETVLAGQPWAPARQAGRWPENVDRQYVAVESGAVQLEPDEKKVTPKQFASRLKLTSVVVEKNGSFEFAFDGGDLFMGHDVVVYGTLSTGPRRADLS